MGCGGKGFSIMNYQTTSFGGTIGYDEHGNCYVSSTSRGGSRGSGRKSSIYNCSSKRCSLVIHDAKSFSTTAHTSSSIHGTCATRNGFSKTIIYCTYTTTSTTPSSAIARIARTTRQYCRKNFTLYLGVAIYGRKNNQHINRGWNNILPINNSLLFLRIHIYIHTNGQNYHC